MHSIRVKFTLTLLFASVSAVLLVGLLAHHLVLARFDELAMARAFDHFQADVRGFLADYGSWQQGEASEGFMHYVSRIRRPPAGVGGLGSGGPPPMRPPPMRPPPFRFVLLAPNGTVLQGPPAFPRGSTLPANLRARERAITLDGRIRAYAVPIGQPNLSELDRSYLAAIRQALLYSLLSVSALMLLVGIFFGNRLSKSLRELTAAVIAMDRGDLRQQVDIQTRDEIGFLARSFNKMSEKLAQAYESLETSHQTVSEQAARLKELSIRDDLTGLYNRRHFNDRIKQLLSHAQRYSHPISIAICDIDDFKKINDNFSHSVGDRVLKTVAHLIQTHTRETDVAARFGGEEFVIAFPETGSAHAITLCERLRRQIEDYDWPEIASGLKVTISMGLETNAHPETSDKMLIAADQKLYAAKDAGKNRLVA